jgi:NTE family protein
MLKTTSSTSNLHHSLAGRQEKQALKKQPKRIGLAISAGGAKGLAHVGVIQVLEEHNIPIAAVSGSSMGAYVGALWCAGYKGHQLQKLAEEIQTPKVLRKLSDPVLPPSKGLFWGRRAKAHLRRSIGDITFEKLTQPLYVITADIDTNQRIVCNSGKVIDAVHASCAMPGVIVPVNYKGHRCVDGGIVDPVPISILKNRDDIDAVIAISTIPTFQEIEHCTIDTFQTPKRSWFRRTVSTLLRPINLLAHGNVIDTFVRSLKASQIRMAHQSCKHADIVIKPISCLGTWYDYHEYDYFIEIGRQAAEQALPAIRALLNSTSSDEPQANQMVGKCLN